MEVSQETKNITTIWPSNSTPGYISEKKTTTLIPKDTCTSVFTEALCTIAKIWKQPVSINKQMNKEDVSYIHNGILFSHKKEWNFAICSNMDGLGGHYAKWNKSDREFPGGPVVRTQHFHGRRPGSIPGRRTKIPQTVWHGKKKKKPDR